MAVDHALAEQLTPGSAVLRLYEWTEPTVSFGRNEVARDQYARTDQVAFVRRPTGGRAVLHREELTYSVVFPAAKGLRQAYAEIHAALKAGLEALGVRGRLAPQGDAVSPLEPGTCFEHPVGGEILVDAGKLVGSAQARMGSAVLQHGSLLRVEDQTGFDRIRWRPNRPSSPAPTLASVLGSAPPVSEMRTRVVEAFRDRFGPLQSFQGMGALEQRAALLGQHYASRAWTWRR